MKNEDYIIVFTLKRFAQTKLSFSHLLHTFCILHLDYTCILHLLELPLCRDIQICLTGGIYLPQSGGNDVAVEVFGEAQLA